MARVVCSKCGVTGDSKCPHCRKIFQDNQHMAAIRCWLSIQLKEKDPANNNVPHVIIDMDIPNRSVRGSIEHLILTLQGMLDSDGTIKNNPYVAYPTLEQMMCHHDWQFAEGQKSEIQCGH